MGRRKPDRSNVVERCVFLLRYKLSQFLTKLLTILYNASHKTNRFFGSEFESKIFHKYLECVKYQGSQFLE